MIGRLTEGRMVLDLRCLENADELTGQLVALREALGMDPSVMTRKVELRINP